MGLVEPGGRYRDDLSGRPTDRLSAPFATCSRKIAFGSCSGQGRYLSSQEADLIRGNDHAVSDSGRHEKKWLRR